MEKCISCGEKGIISLRYRCGKESGKKPRKKWKKVLTKRSGFANISKRSATGQNRSKAQEAQRVREIESLKKVWKTWKKFLTKRTECGNLIESAAKPARDNLERAANERTQKSLKKLEKSSWQSENDVLSLKPAATSSLRCAPCKLNNVTNTKHQKGDGCLKSFEKSLYGTTSIYFFEAKFKLQ